MSNHVHLIVRAENANLSAVIRDLKSFTSKEIIKAIQGHPERMVMEPVCLPMPGNVPVVV